MRNIEILCFIDSKNINSYFKFLKEEIFVNELEKKFMSYFEKYWLKKFYNFFNYSHLIKDIIKLKNLFVNTKGSPSSSSSLISKLKSLDKVYFTNNKKYM